MVKGGTESIPPSASSVSFSGSSPHSHSEVAQMAKGATESKPPSASSVSPSSSSPSSRCEAAQMVKGATESVPPSASSVSPFSSSPHSHSEAVQMAKGATESVPPSASSVPPLGSSPRSHSEAVQMAKGATELVSPSASSVSNWVLVPSPSCYGGGSRCGSVTGEEPPPVAFRPQDCGNRGTPVRVEWENQESEVTDGFGLCSPTRWRPMDRGHHLSSPATAFAQSMHRMATRFIAEHVGDAKGMCIGLLTQKLKSSPFAGKKMEDLRCQWAQLLGAGLGRRRLGGTRGPTFHAEGTFTYCRTPRQSRLGDPD